MSLAYRMQAYADLWRRYKTIFAHYWAQREQLSGKLLNEQEAAFLPAALSLQNMPVSPAGRLVAKVLMTMVAVVFIWSVVGKVDIVVNAGGKIIPSGNTKAIASVDVASVRALHVKEGQLVKAGDVLVELDSSATDAEHDKASGDQSVALLQVARAKALIAAIDSGRPAQLPPMPQVPQNQWHEAQAHLQGQYQDFYSKLTRITDEIKRFKEALPLVTQRADDFKQLLTDRDVSEHAWMEKEQARTLDKITMDIDGKLINLSPGMSINTEIKTGERRIIEYVLSPLQQHARESINER